MNLIETHELTRTFGKHTAVDRLTLSIAQGQVFGFLGPNGAGKTTTVRMLAALIAPSSGTASVGGYALGSENTALRRAVGILTETPGLYDKLSAMQNLVFFAGLYGVPSKRAHEQAERYLKLLDLWERRDDKVGTFSKGMRQKLAIARALLHDPAVVFLDEPTAGLDPEAARTVHEFIRNMRAEGRTVFLTTHNLAEADALCDTIGVFRTRLLKVGSPGELRSNLFGRGTLVTLDGDAQPWADTVAALPFVKQVSSQDGTLSIGIDDPDAANPALVQALVAAGARIRYVQPAAHSLEEVYLELIGEGGAEVQGEG